MNSFAQLQIWKNKDVMSELDWYYQVSNNIKPSKYLITKRIPVECDLSYETEELWNAHEKASEQFLTIWSKIKDEKAKLADLPITSPSLLDLNEELVSRMLKSCNFCEWNCKIDRTIVDDNPYAKTGTCGLGEQSRVGSYFHHRGEELIFRGTHGSGTIFFTSCCLRCVFCQNGDISKDKLNGNVTTPEELGKIASLLRMEGVHNVNYVGGDPIVHLHTIIRSIKHITHYEFPKLRKPDLNKLLRTKSDYFIKFGTSSELAEYHGELNVPLLWNSSFYMSEDSIKILRTVIDIWLPDFKFGNNDCARRLARTPRYFETISRNHTLLEKWGENYAIRHLIMPNHVECCTKPVFEWIKQHLNNALVNVMDQYHPDSFTNPRSSQYNPRYEDLNRMPTEEEISQALALAKSMGLNYRAATFDS